MSGSGERVGKGGDMRSDEEILKERLRRLGRRPEPEDFGLTLTQMGRTERFLDEEERGAGVTECEHLVGLVRDQYRQGCLPLLLFYYILFLIYMLSFGILDADPSISGTMLLGPAAAYAAFLCYLRYREKQKETEERKAMALLLPAYRRLKAALERYDEAARPIENDLRKLESERHRRELEALRVRKDYWLSLSGYQFETELARLFTALGYDASVTKGSGDEGVDIYLEKDGEHVIVQCKAHKNPVGPGPVRELYGAMMHEEADEGILAALGGFTQGAYDFAANKAIRLLGIDDVISMQNKGAT